MEISKLNVNGTEYALRDESKLPQPEAVEEGQLLQVKSLDENGRVCTLAGIQAVNTVNGAGPDENGNVSVTSTCELTQPQWGIDDTGVYTKIPADYVEGASRTLLWENASPTSTFAAQSIVLESLSSALVGAFIEVEFIVAYSRISTDGDVRTTVRVQFCKDYTGKRFVRGRAFAPLYTAGAMAAARDIYLDDYSVSFSDCNSLNANTVVINNTLMIPYRIYAIT